MNTTASPLAFITGASSGIGQALAVEAVARGWRVALLARRPEALTDWCRQQAWPSDRWAVYAADVRDLPALAQACAQCLAQQGLPDVVVANAGISVGVDLSLAEDLAVVRDVFDTNVLGLAATFQPFIAPMVARGRGTLVGVASVAAMRGLPGHAAYCGAKAAVVNLCETLRGELRPQGVKVVTLTPGYIDTPLTRGNDYPMPFLDTILRGQAWRVIPWPMGVVAWALRRLPRGLFDRLVGAQKHRKKRRRDPVA
jgi:NAD(P)-dependent dehydrogenase (short-subunit alcohol dehydrogenase family)